MTFNIFISLDGFTSAFYLSDGFPYILDHHFVGCYGLHSKQAPLVDVAPAKPNSLFSVLRRFKSQ